MIVIMGASASGKTTLQQDFLAAHPDWHKIVTVTTRQPRFGEVDGRDYIFVSSKDFAQMATKFAFAETESYGGNRYGTPIEACRDEHAIAVLTPKGAASLKANGVPVTSVYIKTDSLSRQARHTERGDAQSMVQRRETADWTAFQGADINADYVIDNTGFRLNREQMLTCLEKIVGERKRKPPAKGYVR